MVEGATLISADSKLLLSLSRSILDILIVTLICTLVVWYTQYHWKRRKLYKLAAAVNGPLTLPFVGNALYLFGSTSVDILNVGLGFINDFESPARIWFGQRLFFVIWKANDLQTIMNSPHALEKGDIYKFTEIVVGTGLFTAPVDKWKRHRKIATPTFNQKILDGFLEVFSEQSEVFVEQLKKEVGKGTFDIIYYVSRYTLDIICGTAMGINVNAQTTESDYAKWTHRAKDIVFARICRVLYHSDFIFNRTAVAQELHDLTNKIHNFTATVIREKRKDYHKTLMENKERPEALITEEPCKRNTFLQQLIELSENGEYLTDEEIRDEVNTFIIAGSDTTATVNSFMFIMLGMFPDVQDRVYEEVMDVLGPDRSVEPADLGKLLYLERVIKETMRIFPVSPSVSRDITEDIKLEKCTIPAGSSVALAIIGVQRDPEVWPNPLKFDPDRFLPVEVAKRHPYSWLPFSGGPRNCLDLPSNGKSISMYWVGIVFCIKYAMMSMKALTAMVIRKYRFGTDYKCIEDIKLKSDLVVSPIDGYKVSIMSRE